MLKLIPLPYKIAAVAFIVASAFGFGYHKGTVNQVEKFEADRQQLQTDLLQLSDDLSAKNAEILRLSKEREELVNDLETQAYEAEGSSGPGVGSTGGLQRLEQRWGSPSGSPL